MLYLPDVVQMQIQLSSNAAENQLLRSEFYYEQVGRQRLNISLISEFSSNSGLVIIDFSTRLAQLLMCKTKAVLYETSSR